jgi:hypothetical protein
MTGPSSPAEPNLRQKLQALITSLQAIEASLGERIAPTGGPDDADLSLQVRKSLEDAKEKVVEMAHEAQDGFTGQDKGQAVPPAASDKPASHVALEQEIVRWASFPELNANPSSKPTLKARFYMPIQPPRGYFPT